MAWFSIFAGLVLASLTLSLVPKVKETALKAALGVVSLVLLVAGVLFSSVHYVPSSRVGIVDSKVFGGAMSPGQVIAREGEIGTQAEVLTPGWHLGYWPGFYLVANVGMVSIDEDEIGLVKAVDGAPLNEGQVFAEEMPIEVFKRLIDNPLEFLGEQGGQKGPQTNVLLPGKHRLNTELFEVTVVPQTNVHAGTVAVLKSNVGSDPTVELESSGEGSETIFLAKYGEKGVRSEALPPGKYPINPKAFETYTVSTERRVANYTAEARNGSEALGAISVKSNDGFNFPVDVRVVYYIKTADAPKVVALLGGDNDTLQQLLTSRVGRSSATMRSRFRRSITSTSGRRRRRTRRRSSVRRCRPTGSRSRRSTSVRS